MTSQYWAGVINTEIITRDPDIRSRALEWLFKAVEAEKMGKELVVLEVPKNAVFGSEIPINNSTMLTDFELLKALNE